MTALAAVAIIAIAGGFIFWRLTSGLISIDTASIQAPEITLTASAGGTLENLYVNEGDSVPSDFTLAQVGNQLIQSKVAGIIISVPNSVGAQVAPGAPVIKMIDPSQLRVVGELDENKGLDQVKVGDTVSFTVDAFGSRKFSGIVDEIAPTSNQSAVVFNISDSRQTQQFDIKVRFDTTAYPELKNGMSARMTIHLQ